MALVVHPVTGVLLPQTAFLADPIGPLSIALIGSPFAFVLVPLGPILMGLRRKGEVVMKC